MLKRLKYIFMTLLLIAALQAAGQSYVIDSVCVSSTRHYRIDGKKLSTYLWKLYDQSGGTVSLTNAVGTLFAETSPEKYGSELEIIWNQPGTFRLEAIQYSEFGCDTLQQGLIKVFEHPQVFPGNPISMCVGSPVSLSEATASNYSVLIWSTSGDGTFSSTTELNPVYTPGPNDLLAGTLTLTLTAQGLGDSGSCIDAVGTVTITISNMQLAVTTTDPLCYNGSDGTIIATVTGAFGLTTFAWTGPNGFSGNLSSLTGLTAGVYSVTVIDANGCSATASVTIGEPTPLMVTASGSPAKCFGANDGTATVSVSGGTATYTYSWSDPANQKTQTATNLLSGVYSVTVTDANGCTATASFTIGEPALLIATASSIAVKCFGGNDGSATVSVSGGTATYTYQWNDLLAQKTQTATGLVSGNYIVTVNDAQGCTATASVTISQPATLTASAAGTPAKCFGGNDGTATVSVSGGTASYTYLWSDALAQTTATASGLIAGSYTVTVTDQNLCAVTASVTITQPTSILITETHVDSKCSGSKPGSINLTVSGGIPGYTYLWSNGATTEDIINLPGTISYTVTVTDANGCTASSNIYIDEEKNLIISETHVDVECFGDASGSIDIKVVGGKKDFLYTWYNLKDLGTVIATTDNITNLPAGTYRITVIDANGCSETREITLADPQKLLASVTGTAVNCSGGNSGMATVSVSGGTIPYTYLWNDLSVQITPTATGLKIGTYTVTVTDASGCTTSVSVTITEPTPLVASVSGINVNCFGGNNGSATASVSGGTASYTYLWDDLAAQKTPTAINLTAGIYRVTITDANSCSASATITISQPAGALTIFASATDVKCFNGIDGTASSTTSGGTAPYTYLWNDPGTQSTANASGLRAGTFTLKVTDVNGCTTSVSVTINQPGELTASITGSDAKCFGSANGTATTIPVGGTSPYTYLWNDPAAQTTQTATGLTAGTYQVRVSDANGCIATATYTINQPTAALTASAVGVDAKCFGGNNGIATVTASGGTAPYIYLWNDLATQTTPSATGLAAGTYSVTVTDINGCSSSASVTIGQPTPITATTSGTDLNCFGGTDGTASVTVTGGTTPYSYQWNDLLAQTTQTATGLSAGLYKVIITDANGCTFTSSITLNEPAASLSASVVGTNVNCFGGNNGTATSTVSGGTLPYTYLWNDPAVQKTQNASGLIAGTYQLIVTDANGCTTSASITITEPAQLSVAISGTDVKCFGASDGTASVLASGGTSPYTYLWNDPAVQSSSTANGLKIGTYQVIVTDAKACTSSATVTLTEPGKLIASVSKTDVKCFGGNDGTAIVSVSGGTASYTYLWNDPASQTTASATGLKVGIYQVTVTDGNNCTSSATVTIGEPALSVTASISHTEVKCFGGNDGTATASASGGTGSYTFSWNDPAAQTSATATGLKAGTYQLVVRDANGCTASASVTINEPGLLIASVVGADVKCFGNSNGSATVSVSGGTASYTYLWSDPAVQTTSTASGLKAGTYQVRVTDANACTTSASVTINEPNLLTASVDKTDTKCNGSSDGTATVSVSGGTTSYTYLWNDLAAQTSATATGLKAGTYQVIVTDANSCNVSATITINEPLLITATVNKTDVKCFGGNDGTAIVSVSGGTASYTYLWNDPALQTTATATGLKAGIYQVTVKDANGCTLTESVTVNEPGTALTAAVVGTDVKCFGGSDGSAIVSASGGTGSYTFTWNDPAAQTGSTASALKAGTYLATVTDGNGCTASASVTINEPPVIAATITKNDVKCFGGNDGTSTVSASGGTSSFTYLWDDSLAQTSQTASGLIAGIYQVKVSDSNGCTLTATVTITGPTAPLSASVTGTDVKCFGGNDGTATVSASGGTATYTYSWNDLALQTSSTAIGLKAGVYRVNVTDANGCATSATVTIKEPVQLIATISGTDVKCFGGNDGTATISASGGTVSYTYLWNDALAQTTPTASNLKAGNYQVTVTDTNGCTVTSSVTINEPSNALTALINSTDVKCFGGNDGSATVSVSGGTATYTYSWNDPATQTSSTAIGLKAGIYQVMVTDANGCTTSASVTIIEPLLLTATVTGTDVKCFGGNDGKATASVSGGTAIYSYLWNDLAAQTSATATGLKAGVYQLVVTDAYGCTATASVTIAEPLLLTASISGTNIKCFGGNDGTATVSAAGGTASYTYLWNDPAAQTSATATGLKARAYQVVVTDANGCATDVSITLTEPALALTASISGTPVKCFGGNDGSATVTASGGTVSYTYLWNDTFAQTTSTATGLRAGIYQVLVTDANGCLVSLTVTISEPAASLLATITDTSVNCFGGNDGIAAASVSGGTIPYTYLWNDPAAQTTSTASGLTAGIYVLTVTDANGCTSSASVTIKEPVAPLTALATGTPVKCFGGSDGIATVTASGGTVSYTYLWDDPAAQTSQSASGLKVGLYKVIVTDANGCTTSVSVTISEPSILSVAIAGTPVKCFGGNDGTATVSATGGTAPYSYLWDDPSAQITATATGLKAGNYKATVTDANNCSISISITILQPSLPLTASVLSTAVKCFGGNDGTATVSVSGGTASYTYQWNDPLAQTTSLAIGLSAGVYQVTVTDANGCTTSASVTISEPPANLAVTISGINVKCFGGNDGKATASVSGGTPVYTYLWNDAAAQTGATASGLIAGNYRVVVTDFNGCTTSATVSISQPATIPTSTTNLIVCENLLPFKWNGNNYAAGGTYSVTLTTKIGCDSIAILNLQIEIPKIPLFAAIGPLCKNSIAPALPVSSINGYAGTWSPSAISTAVAGTVTYTFTPDAGICATTVTLTITVINPIVPQFAAIGPLCKNTAAPVLPANSINGIPGTWSPAIISTATTGTAIYTFTPDAGQCATTATLSIEVTQPFAFAGPSVTICPGSPYTLLAATADYYSTLLWTSSGDGNFDDATKLRPAYNPGPTDMSSGTVTLTITVQGIGSAPGCVPAVSTIHLNIIRLEASVDPSDVTCFGRNNGTIIITELTGGTAAYEYRVNGFGWQSKSQYLNLAPGLYKVEMRDALIPACEKTLISVNIKEPERLSATAVPQDASCLANDGTISIVSPKGGSGSYEYSMNGGIWTTSGYYIGLIPGAYLIEMRDLNVPDCTESLGNVTIAMPVPVTASVLHTDVSCYSGSDGKITITDPKNGSGVYEYSNDGVTWSSKMVFNNLIAGDYTVEMRDFNAKACVQNIGSVTIGEPAQLSATVVPKNITCFGSKDGSITIQSPTGGSGSYEYTIDGAVWVKTTNYSNLGPGTYYVLMRDLNAPTCVVSFAAIDITEPLPLSALVNSDNITCFGSKDGKIIVTDPKNGTPGYEYTIDGSTWTPISTFTGLGTNTYTVQMRDSKGCKETIATLFIIEPKPLTAVVEHTNVTCLGNDGTITITKPENSVSGLYEFSINGGGTWTSTGLFTGLSSNTYTVSIRDSKLISCERTIHTAIITEPVPLLASAEKTDVTCFGANDGVITVKNPSGGSGLYEYSIDGTTWTSTTTLDNLAPSVYMLQMRDAKAIVCEMQIGTYTVTQPEQLAATASPTDVSCYGGNDGFISMSNAKGGSGSYEYSVNGINWFANKIDKLKVGIYPVQMRDAIVKTCIVSLGIIEIKEPAKITADVISTPVTCFGANDGTITISNTQNGIPPYQYSLNGVAPWQSSNIFTGVKAGTYDLIVVSDANNCVSTLAIVTITAPDKLLATLQHTNETAPGANDGTITIIGKGGSETFDYSKDGTTWQPGDTFTGLGPATYTIWMRDANSNNCKISLTITISPAGSISAVPSVTFVACFGGLDGSITFSNPRGAAHYQFSIDNGNSWGAVDQFVFTELVAQSYTLVVRDADSPVNSTPLATKVIIQPTELSAVVTVTPETFAGNKDGAITISSLAGGSGLYDFSIDGTAWITSTQFTGLGSGNYTVQIRDNKAPTCTISYLRTIQPAGELIANVTPVNVFCNGQNTGSILFSNASGASVIEFSIDNGVNWNKTGIFNGLSAANYDVVIRDANTIANRVSLGKVTITQPSKLLAIFGNYTPPPCSGTSGSFSISASGGTPPYKGIGDFVLPSGASRAYTISDKNGCTATVNVSMPDPPKITANDVINSPKCFGENGTIVISATGGTGTLKGIGSFIVQAGKSYSFKVTDANGCSSNIISGIMPPSEILVVKITPISSLCLGGSATVTISATGGIPPYLTGTGTFTVSLGTHTFTVTDSNGCSAVASINISPKAPPAAPVLMVSAQPNCIVTTGTIKVNSPLGVNYLYSLDGGTYTSVSTFAKLAPVSSHTVQVKDVTTSCESLVSSIAINPIPDPPLAPTVTVTQPGCIVATGKIEVTDPKAGTGFEYRLDGGTYTSVASFAILAPGSTHTITIRDLLTGCNSAASVKIDLLPANPATPTATVTVNPTCDNPDGTIVVTSPAGSQYEYTIAGKTQSSAKFTDLVTGTYSITVRNTITGCSSFGSVIVPAIPPSPLLRVISFVNPKCYGDTYTITISMTNTPSGNYNIGYDGGQFANVKILGGTATITGQFTENFKEFNNLTFVANGCTSTGTVNDVRIDNPAQIVISNIKVTEHVLKATTKGAIDITANGGTGQLKYLWSNTATSQDLNDVSFGVYTVTVTDANNCQVAKSIKIPLNNPPVAVADQYFYSCIVLTGDLLVNDYDPDPADQNDFITINTVPVVGPKHAKVFKINKDGTFAYEVVSGYSGPDAFVYEIADKFGQTATATVSIDIVADFDGDGIADFSDSDADGDGILNADEVLSGQNWKTADSDGDGHPNWLDIDADNDGIVDIVEAQATSGYIVPAGIDTDKDGLDDAYDTDQGGTKLVMVNTDVLSSTGGDAIPDFLDSDSDDDLVPDYIEGHDSNANGKPDHIISGKDADTDGLDDAYDTVVNGCNNFNATGSNSPLQDFDGDGMNDWRDENDDNDEYLTRFEDLNMDGDFSNDDIDYDGHPEYLDFGRDCDLFIPDAFSPNGDNIHDYFQIYCINHFPNAKLYIFDQLGNKLFEKEHYGNLDFWKSADRAWWDATTTNRSASVVGNKVVPGTYYYVLRLDNGDVKKSYVFVSY